PAGPPERGVPQGGRRPGRRLRPVPLRGDGGLRALVPPGHARRPLRQPPRGADPLPGPPRRDEGRPPAPAAPRHPGDQTPLLGRRPRPPVPGAVLGRTPAPLAARPAGPGLVPVDPLRPPAVTT